MSKRWLIVLFSVAAVLRLGFVWIAPAWYDEAFTLAVSRLPFDRMMAAVAGDVHPPLWYLITWWITGQLRAWSLVTPIWVLRIPAALFSLGALWLFWKILQNLDLSPRVRTLALVLMAVMPIQLYYALEARMYALLEFLVLLAVMAMLERRWWLFGLAGVLMLYTQYYGIFYFGSLFLIAAWREVHLEDRQVAYFTFVAGALFAPWVAIVMLPQMTTLTGSYWMQLTGPGMLLRVLFDVLFMPPQNAVVQIPLMLAGFGWLVVALIVGARRRHALTIVFALAFLPFLFAVVFSLLWQPVLHYRPLIGIAPFLYILLAGPVDAFPQRVPLGHGAAVPLLAAIFLLPLILICDVSIYAGLRQNKASGATVEMAYVRSHWQTGDIVYHYSDDSWLITAGSGLPEYKAPDCAPTMGGLSPATRDALDQMIVPLSDLTYTRAWLFWADSPLAPDCAKRQLTDLGLDPARPLMLTEDDEYVYEGLWLLSK